MEKPILKDPRGRIVEEIDYWSKARKYTYDKAENLIKAEDPLGRVTTFQSDTLGRLKSKILFDGKTETFEYDPNGNLKIHENEHLKCSRMFDEENRLIEETQGGFNVESQYDEAGNRIRRHSSTGNDVVYNYDGNNQVVCVQINDEAPLQIHRDVDGFAVKETLAGHLERDYEFNLDGF